MYITLWAIHAHTPLLYFRRVRQGQGPQCCPYQRPRLYTGADWPRAARMLFHIKTAAKPGWKNDDGVMRERVGQLKRGEMKGRGRRKGTSRGKIERGDIVEGCGVNNTVVATNEPRARKSERGQKRAWIELENYPLTKEAQEPR